MTVETPDSSPSALSFICPRSQSVGVIEDFRLSSINCNLLTDFESCTGHRHPMEVYLRIRPYVYDNEVTNKVLSCSDAYTVIACPPEADGQKHPSRNFQKSANKFTFNGIFRESATQAKVFEVVAADKVSAFIDGLNGLIFAYGTTSSGKTYTLQGSRNDAGIIPRSLYSIFSLVKHCSDPSLMPRDFSDVVYLSEDEVQKVLAGKSNLIKLSEGIFEMTSLPDDEKGLMSLKDTFKGRSSDLRCIGNIRFSFWISFVEIYNETFYDLLDPVQCSSMLTMASDGTGNIRTTHKQTNFRNIFSVNNNVSDTSSFANYLRRTSLELRTDKNGNLFVKGVKWYPICSPEEGLRLVAIGRQCQKVASTRLNQASSRSHSILFIKAVRVADKSNPNFARVSTLMFCDLAGSERTVKAATAGQVLRIREAGNINSSLLTLGRCIEAVRYNQVHPDNPKLVPYRDSKLTRLFQGFFTGQGRACMIVNASPNPELFGETLHALRFAALAKQVIVEANPVTETAISDRSKVEAKPRFKIIKDIKSYRGNVIISKEPGSLVEAQPTLWSGDDFERKTSSEEGVKGETISLVESDYMCVSKANTSSSDDGMQLILDHFNKGELIGLVKDLSEQLFEAKGELVEQEARLRAEMCDNMNQQMIDFEKKFEEILKARENDVYKESSRRMCNIIETVNQRHARLVTNAKRYCPDDSKCSSDDDISETDDSIQKHFKAKEDTLVCECCSVQKRKVTQLSETLKESENRVAELEGDLADEKDVIKNLMHEVDRLRLENRRLEFTISQQLNKLKFDKKIQTEPVEHAVSPRSSSKAYDLDDSCVVVNLNKEMHPSTPTDHVIEKLKSFSLYESPSAQNILTQVNVSQSFIGDTPLTVVKGENKPLLNGESNCTIEPPVLIDEALRSIHEDEGKFIQAKNKYVIFDARESRISEGLQSFLQHESSFQHQEVVERLQRRIYEIEEIFAMKHDALVESETAFCELKARYDDLSQRLIAQTNDLHQSTLKLEKVKQLHKEELEAHTNEAEKRIVELKVDLRTALEHNAALLSHIPDIDAGVQTIFSEPSILCDSTAVQTSICQVNELCVQTCLVDQGISVGVQTEKCNPTSTSKSASQTGGEVVTSEYEESNESNCTYKPDHRTIQGKRNLGNANRLRLKHNRGRPTQRLGPPKIPDLLSPIASSVCMSDSELELISTLADGIEKENLNSTSEEIEDDDDTHKSKSVLRSISTRTTRRNNAKKVNGTSTEPRKRRTVLAAAQRRLPHLAESSQLLPDSFFQDQLDEALEVVDAELRRTEHRKLRELPLRQGPRRRR